MEGNGSIFLTAGEPPYHVQAEAFPLGDDLIVMVTGGQKPHVGAVAVGLPRPSLADAQQTSATVSVFTLIGHKEDELARSMAHKLAAALQRNTVVTAGIHVEKITPEAIKLLEKYCSVLLEQLVQRLKA